jgi:hypothetical protein
MQYTIPNKNRVSNITYKKKEPVLYATIAPSKTISPSRSTVMIQITAYHVIVVQSSFPSNKAIVLVIKNEHVVSR